VRRTARALLVSAFILGAVTSASAQPGLAEIVAPLLAEHPGRTGAYVLEKGEESLLARAWLADHAGRTIDVQYFIWSTDNVGVLAAEALLRAAERGVRVRVLVDDLLVDAPPESLLALAEHPSIEIRIYNPMHKVGTSAVRRVGHLVTDFRAANQRMHDKTVIVDGVAAVTGGRNMADEYYDFDHEYNFRDRDALVLGPVVADMEASFERFWTSDLAAPVERLLRRERDHLTAARVRAVYRGLHAYAAAPENFAPEVRQALADLPGRFPALLRDLAWVEARFLCDRPGKNEGKSGLRGGGDTTRELVGILRQARRRVTIESPYLILPEGGLELFRELVRRGVEVRIVTNSLASTDNLQAFSGYAKQRRDLLKAGIALREFRPHAAVERELLEHYGRGPGRVPMFAIHAKTLVVDGETLFVGTFNLDPRSANLNTEVGVLLPDPRLAAAVEKAIERDMAPENSWDPATDDPDSQAGLAKRLRLRLWRLLPLTPVL
jgi:putative cardiolipin synthase